MKKLMMVCLMIIGTQVSFGQEATKSQPKKEKMTVEQKAESRTAKMESELKLTADQRTKIYDINLNTIKKNMEIRQNKSLTDEQRKEQVKASLQAGWKQIEPILTKEQKKILKDKKLQEKDTPEMQPK